MGLPDENNNREDINRNNGLRRTIKVKDIEKSNTLFIYLE